MYEWTISLRYLRAKYKTGFVSLISLISIAGIAVGVMALIVVLAVYSGFTTSLRDQILGVNSHIIVQQLGGQLYNHDKLIDKILTVEGTTGATPYMHVQTMISSSHGGNGIILRGMETESAKGVVSLHQQMISGSTADLDSPNKPHLPNIILGKNLANSLRVLVGDKIRLISPSGPITPMGVIPKIKTCIVSGIFESGMYEYDSQIAYMGLTNVQNFLGNGEIVHGIEVAVRESELNNADKIAAMIVANTNPAIIAKDWMTMNSNLFAAFKLEKIGMFICVALIILVAALNIVSALTMMVMEKKTDIAILKSMGATSRSIMKIFFFQGIIITAIGSVSGLLGGLGLCELLSRYQFITLPANVYPMSTLPIKVLPFDIGVIMLCSIIISLSATIYPSWQAAKVEPAEVLS